MNVLAVVQARLGSSRLPGKVLADLGGRPALAYQLARVLRSQADLVVVATSTDPRDDPVAEVASTLGVTVVRGPESDVLARFKLALESHPADHVVRLTADCPFTDPALIDEIVAKHVARSADYTSNTLIRTYPDGLDVEVVRSEVLQAAADEADDEAEREHVTPFVYRRPDRFRLVAHVSEQDAGDERWTLDTVEDLQYLREVVGLVHPGASWTEILNAIGRRAAEPVLRVDSRSDDPSTRAWIGPGWVRVEVHDAVGTLAWELRDDAMELVLRDLQDRLRADLQVRELRASPLTGAPWDVDAIERAGFVVDDDGAVWTR